MRIRFATSAILSALAVAAFAAPALADTTGHYIVADDAATPAVYDFTPTGTRATIASGAPLVNPENLVRLGADDYLVADKGPTGAALADGLVIRVRNGAQTVLASAQNLVNPHGLALSADRKTAFVAGRDGRIVAITIATGAQRLVATLTADLRGIAVERSGSLLVVDSSVPTRLLRVDANSGAQTTLYTGQVPASDLRSVLVMPNGNIVLGDQGVTTSNGAVFTGPPTGPFAPIASGPFFAQQSVPGAMALDANGDVVIADRNNAAAGGGPGRIYKVSLKGALTPIVTDASALLNEPGGLAIVPPKCGGKDTLIPGKGRDKVISGPGRDTLKCSPLDPRCG